jgi:N-carbamoylputrescine amidase
MFRRISPPLSELVREAAAKGAKLILPPELFEGHYFCRTQDEGHFVRALPADQHPVVRAMQKLAAELQVYIPTSFFEAEGHHHYNSLAMIDDKGTVMGVYRKSHIPDGPGYSEKFYFRPGIPASRLSTRRSGSSAPPSAGTNGIRRPPER